MNDLTLLVIAKDPLPGKVKTRLIPDVGAHVAADLAAACLADTLDAVAATPVTRRVLVLDGSPGAWLPEGIEVVAQSGGGLADRLAAAFAGVRGPAFLIGMDTPQVTPALLDVDLTSNDAVLGLASDGGFWGIGMRVPDPSVFAGVPMSTARTGAALRAQLVRAGMRVTHLPVLTDVDTMTDAFAVAAEGPTTRFAAAMRRLPELRRPAALHLHDDARTPPVSLGARPDAGRGALADGAARRRQPRDRW